MSDHEPAPGQRPGVTRRSKMMAILILGMCVIVGAIALSFPWLDTLDQRWTRCDVTEAVPFQGDNTSMQPWKLQIRTTDCENIIYSEGVTEENVQQLADAIEPGPYDIKLSWVSRRLADGWWPTIAPSTKEYRQAE